MEGDSMKTMTDSIDVKSGEAFAIELDAGDFLQYTTGHDWTLETKKGDAKLVEAHYVGRDPESVDPQAFLDDPLAEYSPFKKAFTLKAGKPGIIEIEAKYKYQGRYDPKNDPFAKTKKFTITVK
jgi:predicted secreted protein